MSLPWMVLERHESTNQGTFGKLYCKDKVFFTGELPWKDNRPSVSCIFPGVYSCSFVFSPRFKRKTYLLNPVKGRSAIRIHSANFMGDASLGFLSQLNGCIALGEKIGFVDKQKCLFLSRPAIRKFEDLMEEKPFMLEIINAIKVMG